MRRFVKGFVYAFAGIFVTFQAERNFRIHVVALGLYLGLSFMAWGFITFAIGLVLSAELFNTAIERLGDEAANGERNQMVRKAKDISAGAVLITAFTALTIGILFLFIPLVHRILAILSSP